MYSKSYPVKVSGGFARLYKAVHKDKDGKYRADYDKSFAYIISKKVTCECDQQTLQSCSFGIHVSHLQWAVNFGKSWDDLAILEEIEIDLMDILRRIVGIRKAIYKAAGIVLLIGIVVAISIPKQYTVTVTLSPEVS